ncbi:MAG: hypothetical protein HY289_16535 [Planctomycetes bacterium]|nr:hypothetical protein [Planctomycetota bacterium]
MASDELEQLKADIARRYSEARLTPVSSGEVGNLRQSWPGIPDHYVDYLSEVGWGEVGAYMFFSGPVGSEEIYGDSTISEFPHLGCIQIVATDSAGGCIGFDTLMGWKMVMVDLPHHPPYLLPEQTMHDFVRCKALGEIR